MTARAPQRMARGVAAVLLAVAATVTFSADALATPPQRVGWWNTLSANGSAAPAPTTPAGGMHVAAGPGQVLAYGAVLYSMPADAAARLTLSITASQGTPVLLACPTKDTAWKAGDDQASDAAPAYDCDTSHYPGTVSADGTTVTFTVTTFGSSSGQQLSLAIVPDLSGSGSPVAGANQPFSLDIDKPGSGSLTVTSAAPPSPSAPAPAPPPAAFVPPPSSVQAGAPLGVPLAPNPPAVAQPVAPTAPAPQVAPSPSSKPTTAVQSSPRSSSSAATTAGSLIGVLALVAALISWGLGRGLLGGRIVPLSMPLVRLGEDARRTPSETPG